MHAYFIDSSPRSFSESMHVTLQNETKTQKAKHMTMKA